MAYEPIPVPLPVSQSGTWNVTGSFYPATQPVSGTVTANVSGTVPVSGTFWQATQPISGNVGITGSVAVTGTFWQATQPISAVSLPLPTGAATDLSLTTLTAKVPSLGTVGTPSADVITVQGSQFATPQSVRLPETTQSAVSVNEQFDQLFAANMAMLHVLTQLLAVARGQNAPPFGEEADQLIGEFIEQRNRFTNVIN